MTITEINPLATRELRQAILRPHQTLDELVYPGDMAEMTKHFGLFQQNELLGIISIYQEAIAHANADTQAWRIRGMAVVPALQGRGLGTALARHALDYCQSQGASVVWCHARTSAHKFYLRLGFCILGEEFVIKDIGPHYLMLKEFTK
ncbi:MAG: GNAT family N-acetyltransferase [Legionellales bacterium]|nr:GNAT family N-acetyltransferase [Legionellales bacterium]